MYQLFPMLLVNFPLSLSKCSGAGFLHSSAFNQITYQSSKGQPNTHRFHSTGDTSAYPCNTGIYLQLYQFEVLWMSQLTFS